MTLPMAHDWEALYARLETATESWSRPELIALLRDLIREYVIERGLPTGTPEQAAAPDLSAMDFPQLVSYLKRTVRLPELNQFTVDGRRVIVDIDGPRVIRAQTTGRPPAPAPAAPAARAPEPPPPPPPEPAVDEPVAEADDGGADPRPLSKRFKRLEFD
jgi:hypothetical protein